MKKLVLLTIFILISKISIGQECLNVKFKLRGYFYVGTSQVDTTALGGFYEDQNIPKKLTPKNAELFNQKELQLIVKTDSITEFEKGIVGFKVFIANMTDSIAEIPAEDSRLNLKRQVFYKDKWQDLEYLPSSWCGNSYHNVFIKPNEYWDLKAPCLKGKIKSKFRFQLYIHDNLIIYSNEFKGSFNKKQLKKEQGYKPIGIMDPYNN